MIVYVVSMFCIVIICWLNSVFIFVLCFISKNYVLFMFMLCYGVLFMAPVWYIWGHQTTAPYVSTGFIIAI